MAIKKKQPKQHQSELISRMEARTDQPPSPLVNLRIERPEPLLAGAQKVLERTQKLQVTNADEYALCAEIRSEIRAERDALEARRVKLKKPILQAGRDVDELFNPAIDTMDIAIEAAGDLLQSYDAQQRRIAETKQREAEAEAKRTREEAERQAAEQRHQTQMAMSEIQGINHQVMIASVGRAGVRNGGTLECIRETLAETETWVLIPEHFGALYNAAVQAKQTAVASIKALEAQFLAKQEQERIAAEQVAAKAAGDAERLKAAEEAAAAERGKALEARKAQLRAEQDTQKAKDAANQVAAASTAQADALEQKAATTIAPTVEYRPTMVAGLSRPKSWKWRLLDKSKLKPEYTIVDEKSISKLVIAAHERAHEMVGEGAIEIYQEEGLRQDR